MITAHSGCDHTADNSLEFIEYALSLPVEALEVDVRKSANGELILSHDETDEEAVLLATAFELLKAHPEKKINCDLKNQGIEADVVALAKQYGVDAQLIFTGWVNPELFRKGNVVFPQVTWYANLEVLFPDFDEWEGDGRTDEELQERLGQLLLELTQYEAPGFNLHYGLANQVWEKAHELGLGASVWTVNDPELQELWLKRGAANITTRKVAQLLSLKQNL